MDERAEHASVGPLSVFKPQEVGHFGTDLLNPQTTMTSHH